MPGRHFPPTTENERLERYAQNKLIFDNEHGKVYGEQFKRIEKVIGSIANVISYPIILNFQKKISLKTADFLFMEKPVIGVEGKQDTIRDIIDASDLFSIGYQGVIDCSRYGTCVYKIDSVDGKGKISISSPEYLFTVVDIHDRKKIIHHVMAWTFDKGEGKNKDRFLISYIHSKGSYRKAIYALNESNVIQGLVIDSHDIKTRLDDFAIIPVHNVLTSDSIYGIDDYIDVDSIVSELEVRTAQISKILDTHANPTISGSAGALTKNSDGSFSFNTGNFYPRNTLDEPPLEYITWEANLDANFKQIDRLLNHLCVISEMGAAIFDAGFKSGEIPSGTALKRLYINALAKVARVRTSFDTAFKKAISLASQIGYAPIKFGEINITWQDGLPNDPYETAQIIAARTAGAQTMSIERVLRQYDGMIDEGKIEGEKADISLHKNISQNP